MTIHTLSSEHVVFRFSPDLTPALHISDSDIVRIETRDCFNEQIKSQSDEISAEIDIDRANPVTGPIFVDGLEPGDGLALEILEIILNPKVVTGLMPGIGILANHYLKQQTRVGFIEGEWVQIYGVEIPARPMIGTIGTAPKSACVPSLMMGNHGGNMDHPVAKVGSIIFLPVEVPGGLFALGDLHAAMGDGEITALSAEGSGWVVLRAHIMKAFPIKRPYFRTLEGWTTTGHDSSLSQAIANACADMVCLLLEEYELNKDDCVMTIGLCGDVRISQCAGVPGMGYSARCSVPFLNKLEGTESDPDS